MASNRIVALRHAISTLTLQMKVNLFQPEGVSLYISEILSYRGAFYTFRILTIHPQPTNQTFLPSLCFSGKISPSVSSRNVGLSQTQNSSPLSTNSTFFKNYFHSRAHEIINQTLIGL